jgi:hypothetical protein
MRLTQQPAVNIEAIIEKKDYINLYSSLSNAHWAVGTK